MVATVQHLWIHRGGWPTVGHIQFGDNTLYKIVGDNSAKPAIITYRVHTSLFPVGQMLPVRYEIC